MLRHRRARRASSAVAAGGGDRRSVLHGRHRLPAAADEGGFVIDYLTPAGTALDETDRQVRAMEKVIADTPEVACLLAAHRVGAGLFATPQNTRRHPGAAEAARPSASRSAEEIITDLRPKLHEAAPLAEIEFVQLLQDMLGDLEGNPTPIEVKIFGDDPDELAGARRSRSRSCSSKIDGVVDVVGMQRGNPEVTWNVDPVAAARLGLTVEQVSRSSCRTPGSATSPPTCGCSIAAFRCASGYPDALRLRPDAAAADTRFAAADGQLMPVVGAGAAASAPTGRPS